MNPDKFDIEVGWKQFLSPFIDCEYFDHIYAQLRNDHAAGATIYPASRHFWRPFNLCPYENLKVVLIADGPYNYKHTNKQGTFVLADGLALSASLVEGSVDLIENHWYQGIERELHGGLNLNLYLNQNLNFLAEQGVLMLNSGITAMEGDNVSHFQLWKPFMDAVLEKIRNDYPATLACILIGDQAKEFSEIFTNTTHQIIKCEHPIKALKERRTWRSNGIFSKTNEFLKKERNLEILWAEEFEYKEN